MKVANMIHTSCNFCEATIQIMDITAQPISTYVSMVPVEFASCSSYHVEDKCKDTVKTLSYKEWTTQIKNYNPIKNVWQVLVTALHLENTH